MAQKTNLNVTPYFDDFDPTDNYYRVLFNPGRPVQTRELNTLQSILQNQIETFGSNIFKEGTVVVPGNIVYDGNFYAVKLNQLNFGVDISIYIQNFIGKKITGQSSGISAIIQYVEFPNGNDIEYVTIFVKYINSDNNNQFNQFTTGESLYASENVTYGNTTINSGTLFASLITSDATSIGSAVSIGDGVYFIRGTFVKVNKQTLLLDAYNNSPSYRVGLKVSEEIITAKDDPSLYDNAKGFSNYAAPGADRLKISVSLTKKSLDDSNDTDFVELLRLKNGYILKVENKTEYNIIKDYLAQRTYDESGDYTVTPFKISVNNSLNDRLGNDGIFFDNEKTEKGSVPSDDLLCVKLSPGKAYVRGYDIQKTSTTILDIDKPRDTRTLSNVGVPFEMGNLIRVNNVSGAPLQKQIIYLQDSRSSSTNVSTGTTIGYARVYNYNVTDAPYSSSSTNWDLYLYDIQTYTQLTLNTAISSTDLPPTSFVKGKSSGASGYTVYSNASSSTVFLSQTSGTFSVGEKIIINGTEDVSRTIASVIAYDSTDIKSLFQFSSLTGLSTSFVADSILYPQTIQGFTSSDQITISPISSGISTVTSAGKLFSGIKNGSILKYSRNGFTVETYNKIIGVSTDGLSMTITGVSTVSGVCDGGISTSTIAVPFSIISPSILNESNASLFSILPNSNISSVNLSNSQLIFSSQSTTSFPVFGNTLTVPLSSFNLPNGLTTAIFQSFDAERYSLQYSDGNQESLTSDKVSVSPYSITFNGIQNKTVSSIFGTFTKSGIQSKIKQFNRSNTINITLSKYATSGSSISSSINDGLTYNRYYGLRVQDEEICLNYPDVTNVLAIYESLDTSNPSLDQLSFNAIANVTTNAIIGENIIGADSKAIARIVSKPVANNLEIVYLNKNRFNVGEVINFKESNISTNLVSITIGTYKDITNDFSLDRGQKNQYYDYCRIVRNSGATEPSRRLKIVFDYYSVPSSDNGDAFTVLSYDAARYSNDIPFVGFPAVRGSDILDFRPYVPVFSSTTSSPFAFESRNFGTSLKTILSPGETFLIGYSFYLPRIDKVYLNKLGEFYIEKGVSSLSPKSPTLADDVMELATIILPAYLYSPRDARISLKDNRRYTMRDIGKIDNRVGNLERVTSLSLLELNTATLQIQDANNLNSFRTGFFVDDFSTNERINMGLSYVEVDSLSKSMTPKISTNTLANQIIPATSITDQNLDLSVNFDLLDSNVQKTGDAVTLKYESIGWIEQPLATRVENVNPFHVVVYAGKITLNPERDTWVRTIFLPDETVYVTDTRTDVNEISTTVDESIAVNNDYLTGLGFESTKNIKNERARLLSLGTVASSSQTTTSSTSSEVSASVITTSSVEPDTYMRSRNTEFVAVNLRPGERYYQFLDGSSGVDFIPKLIEISPDSTLANYGASSAFAVGETVIGSLNGKNIISFRVCASNHKSGPYAAPTETYVQNPYATSESIPSAYSQSSKTLNIDTFALSQEAQGDYYGYVTVGTKLVGQSSGSVAYVKDLRLIADDYGYLTGSFFLQDPNSSPPPTVRITTGTKTFKLTSSSTNETPIQGSTLISSGESNYISEGTIEYMTRIITQTTTQVTTLTINNITTETTYYDPLAQSFTVGGNIEAPSAVNQTDDINGAFLTAVDVFFSNKDSGNAPVTCEIRTVELGTPTRTILGKSVTLNPAQVSVSSDATVPTKFTFPYPIYLAPGLQYAVVLLAPESDQYEVWIAEMGENTVNSASLPGPENVRYTTQFAIGRLYKSQNGAEWTPNDYQDMKFKLYKANFTSSQGTAFFQNPTLSESNGYVETLGNNPLITIPRQIKVGVTPITDPNAISLLDIGRKIGESAKSYVYGYIDSLGSPTSSVGLTTGGSNYVVDSSVSTYNITGNGSGLTINITAVNGSGVITSAISVNAGTGYKTGDVVGIVTSSVSSNTGKGATFTITASSTIDTLYLTNFSGDGFDDSSLTSQLVYYDNSNNRVSWSSTTITDSTPLGSFTEGNFIAINQMDHGMYANNNKLDISNAISNFAPVQLVSPLTSSNTSLSVSSASTTNFGTFEGMPVSVSNPGYLKIENEIIKYESVASNGVISGLTRASDNTIALPYDTGSLVYKYELNGISLRRINTTHDISDYVIDIDGYYIEIDRTSTNGNIDRSIDRNNVDIILPNSPMINFNNFSSSGGDSVTSTKNIMYTSVFPGYEVITPGTSTSLSATIRTVSGTSVAGNETSFIDQGYENIQLNADNVLSSTRIVCSNPNETTYLNGMPRNKSLVTALSLSSSDSNLSPLVFINNSFTEFKVARFSNPITNYSDDGRVNSITDDPNASYYVSNTVLLEQPSTSLKVIFSAYRHSSSDIRVLYNLIRADSSEITQTFDLFPGYDNLTIDNNNDGFLDVVDASKNSGLPDTLVSASADGQFKEYQYTASNIGPFTGFTIKIVLAGTNQAYYPMIKDLRAIALA
jgi:hypothetical protein